MEDGEGTGVSTLSSDGKGGTQSFRRGVSGVRCRGSTSSPEGDASFP